MQIKTYQGEHKIEYSIANLKGLEEKLRIGAETYHPEKIKALLKLRKIAKLSDVSTYFDVTKKTFNPKLNETKENYLLELENIGNFEIYNIPKVLTFSFKSSKNVTEYGDIVVSKLRPYLKQIGFIFLKDKVYTTTELIPLRLKKSFNNSLSFYLYIYLMTNKVQTIFFWSQEGTNHPRFPKYILSELPLPIPSLSFRKQIENLVLTSYKEREKANELYKEAEDILSEELGLKNWKPKTKKIKIDGEEFEEEGNISIRRLSECLKVDRFDAEYWLPRYDEIENLIKNYKNGFGDLPDLISISKEKIKISSNEYYSYIELNNINSNIGTIDQTKEIIGANLPSRAKMKINKNYILMSSVEGSIKKIALVDFEKNNLIASTGFFIFKEKGLNKETILLLLKSLCELYIKRQAQGTILTAIPNSSLKRIILPKVDLSIQPIITKKIKESFKSRRKSKELLEIAKRGVEIYIENDEQKGINYITKQLQNLS